MSIFFLSKKMSLFLPQWWQICVTCFLCLLVINICPVFLCINEKYLWVSDHRRLSVAATALSEFWCVLILLWSLVSFNVVIVFLESPERRHYGLELWCWRGYELVSIWFFLCFFFIFVYWCLFSFCSVEMKMGWWLCFSFVIFSKNHEYGFLDWRYGFFSYGVVLLDAYLDSTCLVLS